MSALYLSMLRECGIDKGQTIAIAVCKCIGTRTPTICGTPEGNRFIPVTDGIYFVWDVIYIVELKKVGKREKARTAGPHSVRHFSRFCAILLVFCAFTVSRDSPRWLTTI